MLTSRVQLRLIRKSFSKLLACFPRNLSFPATKISMKINPPSDCQQKKKSCMLLKFPLKNFRRVWNLISCLSRGVWKQLESLSPEGYRKGRPKTGSLNQFQQCACIHANRWKTGVIDVLWVHQSSCQKCANAQIKFKQKNTKTIAKKWGDEMWASA